MKVLNLLITVETYIVDIRMVKRGQLNSSFEETFWQMYLLNKGNSNSEKSEKKDKIEFKIEKNKKHN